MFCFLFFGRKPASVSQMNFFYTTFLLFIKRQLSWPINDSTTNWLGIWIKLLIALWPPFLKKTRFSKSFCLLRSNFRRAIFCSIWNDSPWKTVVCVASNVFRLLWTFSWIIWIIPFNFRASFEQGVPWHSGNYRVWIHSETRKWHDKNIQTLLLVSPI